MIIQVLEGQSITVRTVNMNGDVVRHDLELATTADISTIKADLEGHATEAAASIASVLATVQTQEDQIAILTSKQGDASGIHRTVEAMLSSSEGNGLKAAFAQQSSLLEQLAAQTHLEAYCGAACKPGEFLAVKCSFDGEKAVKGMCRKCAPDTFSAGGVGFLLECPKYSVCKETDFEVVAPTISADRVCQACTTTCPRGEYVGTNCSATADVGCKACTTVRPSSAHYLAERCTPTADGSWLPCKKCDTDTETVAKACTASADTQCKVKSLCGEKSQDQGDFAAASCLEIYQSVHKSTLFDVSSIVVPDCT
jgi:hypothetical protein